MPTKMSASLTKELMLTVYNDGFALVREIRTIPPLSDDPIIYYLDVPQLIESNSIQVKGFQVAELNYEYDLVDKYKLLEKYVGHEIKLVDKETNVEKRYRLLSAQSGLVLEDLQTQEIVLDATGEIRLPEFKDELTLKPALVWRIRQQTAEDTRVTYLTRGLKWDVDYIAQIREDKFDLMAWVTLTNNSGMTYHDAVLKLMAGTVSRAPERLQKQIFYSQEEATDFQPEHQTFGDYHLYTYPDKVTIKDRQQKQVQLLSANQVPSEKVYEVDAYRNHPTVYFTFKNSVENGLGLPLPKGRFKLYQENLKDGSPEFIGEDRISHTAVDEIVRIKSGEAFDITVENAIVAEYKRDGFEFEEVEYRIRNQKDDSIELIVNHGTRYRIFDVVESTHDWKRKNGEIQLNVPVPAKSEVKVAFTIRYDRTEDGKVN